MVVRRRPPLTPQSALEVVALLEKHRSELMPFYMWLPIKSPARAALKTLLDQQAEIVGCITGNREHFVGKGRTDHGHG